MQPLDSRWLGRALAVAAVLVLPSVGSAQEQGTDKLATLKAAAAKVAPVAVQTVQQKVGGSSGSSSGTAGKVVDAVKQAAAPAPQQQGTSPTLTQRAVGAVKQIASKRQASQPAAAPSSSPASNWPVNMPVNMPRPAAPSGGGGGGGGGGGAPPP